MSSHRFDGLEVDLHQARFAGAFDVEDPDASRMTLDAEIMFVVVARVKGASLTDTPSGDVKRVNTLGVSQVRVVRKSELTEQLYDELMLDRPETELPFPEAEPVPAPVSSGDVRPFTPPPPATFNEIHAQPAEPYDPDAWRPDDPPPLPRASGDDMLRRFLAEGDR